MHLCKAPSTIGNFTSAVYQIKRMTGCWGEGGMNRTSFPHFTFKDISCGTSYNVDTKCANGNSTVSLLLSPSPRPTSSFTLSHCFSRGPSPSNQPFAPHSICCSHIRAFFLQFPWHEDRDSRQSHVCVSAELFFTSSAGSFQSLHSELVSFFRCAKREGEKNLVEKNSTHIISFIGHQILRNWTDILVVCFEPEFSSSVFLKLFSFKFFHHNLASKISLHNSSLLERWTTSSMISG